MNVHGATGSICPTCNEAVPGEQERAEPSACSAPPRPWEGSTCLCVVCIPSWFAPLRRRVDSWIDAHPGEAYPVPAWVREMAAGRPLSAARVLLHYLGARGIQIRRGSLPGDQAP